MVEASVVRPGRASAAMVKEQAAAKAVEWGWDERARHAQVSGWGSGLRVREGELTRKQ